MNAYLDSHCPCITHGQENAPETTCALNKGRRVRRSPPAVLESLFFEGVLHAKRELHGEKPETNWG